jgi:hypothetical protein
MQMLEFPAFVPGFLEYGYKVLNDLEIDVYSAWYLKFYDRVEFIGAVRITEDGTGFHASTSGL